MNNQKLWRKILGQNEQVIYEFTISWVYRGLSLAIWLVLSLAIILATGLYFSLIDLVIASVIIIFWLIGWFYFIFYLPRANAFCLTNRRIVVHRGWLSSRAISVNYSQITDVSVEQNVWQKLITNDGVISINTAGTDSQEVFLSNINNPYLLKQRLENLSDQLSKQNFKTPA